jgi:hypothetical protein
VVPEAQQHNVGALQEKAVGALAAVIKDVLVQKPTQAVNGDIEQQGSFGFGEELLERLVGSGHAVVAPVAVSSLYPL